MTCTKLFSISKTRTAAAGVTSSGNSRTDGSVFCFHVCLVLSLVVVQEYPDYYQLIQQPIALSTIRKRISSHHYRNVLDFREDMRLMFNNARTYNQEGSWVYVDAEEMEKAFDAAFVKNVNGSGLPGAPSASAGNGSTGGYDSALTPMEDDERPAPRGKSARRQVISDDEYMTPSDDD